MAIKRRKAGNDTGVTIVIRRDEVVEGGHHGGAWKVAYADFVTAMMAFFLLMWLLNATTEEQRRGIANYFAPSVDMSRSSTGSGLPFGGKTPYDNGDMVSDRGAVQVMQAEAPLVHAEDDDGDVPVQPRPESGGAPDQSAAPQAIAPAAVATVTATAPPADQARVEKEEKEQADAPPPAPPAVAEPRPVDQEALERQSFEQAAQQIRDAVRNDPSLADLARQLAIDLTPEGLRIQILDEDKMPMFPSASATPNERARLLLQKVAPVLQKLTEDISISGHTDAQPFTAGVRSNWELSADRANATRRLLLDGGLDERRIRSVTGNADRDPLLPASPLAAANRRIAIVVLRAARPPTAVP